MVLCLQRLFENRDRLYRDEQFEVQCSYLEVRPCPRMEAAWQLPPWPLASP